MKKIVRWLSFSVLLVVLLLCLQTRAFPQVRVGGEAGINIATLSVSLNDFYWDDSRVSSYVGPAFGGIVQADLTSLLFLRIEPMYVQKGTKLRIDYSVFAGPPLSTTQPLKLEFLELPVTLGIQFGEGALRPHLFAGPNIGYMLTRGYSRIDFALDAGLGGEYALSSACSILLDVRYSAGLNNLNSEDPGAPELRSRGIQPMVGLLFRP
ncbi:MAG TPA: porin family protein [Bacteroidota bacterium]|jgi:hypothetical protein